VHVFPETVHVQGVGQVEFFDEELFRALDITAPPFGLQRRGLFLVRVQVHCEIRTEA